MLHSRVPVELIASIQEPPISVTSVPPSGSGVSPLGAADEGGGYVHRTCLWLSTSSILLFPRSAISKYPGMGWGTGGMTADGDGAADGIGALGLAEGVLEASALLEW